MSKSVPAGLSDPQQIVAVPVGQQLRAEDVVLIRPDAVDVVGRVVQVRGDRGPVEDRHGSGEEHVVRGGHQPLVIDGRLAGRRIEHRLAAPRIDHRLLQVLKVTRCLPGADSWDRPSGWR